jgi:predicted AAA+ superfamily ATPase
MGFVRSIYNKIDWNEKLVGIKGQRGVGKTTLLLQFIKNNYGKSKDAMYISLDDLYFADNKLIDFADNFVKNGGKHLFIDEVHKYKNWAIEIKNIYDYNYDLKIVFTGSSLLEIINARADLSRRSLNYNMQGLSFKEYLNLNLDTNFKSYNLSEIINNHQEISSEISSEIKPIQHFNDYLRIGYYPFYENEDYKYFIRLNEIINMIMEIEFPLLRNTDISIVSKIKQMLFVISQSVPFKPNISSISNKIKSHRKTVVEYITYLNEANILKSISKAGQGLSRLQKPDKIFLDNTNLMYALRGGEPDKGNLRETFFLNQLSYENNVNYTEIGDFLVNEKYTFEIGGKNKTKSQIKNIDNSFIASDNIEQSIGDKIPLWLFGFLY